MSELIGVLSVGATCGIGYALALLALGPGARGGQLDRILSLGLSPLLGSAWVAASTLVLLMADAHGRLAALLALITSLLALFVLARASRRSSPPARLPESPLATQKPPPFLQQGHAVAFCIVSILAAIAFVLWSIHQPYGSWDAYAFWNHRPILISRLGEEWRLAFQTGYSTNVDYPLLLPMTILQGYSLAGRFVLSPPIAFAAATCIGLALLMMALTSKLTQRWDWSAPALMIGAPAFARQGAQQYADLPLAYAMTAAVGLGMVARNANCRRFALLAGALASIAAFIKNEGVVFLLLYAGLAVSAVLAPARLARWILPRSLALATLLGMAPMTLVLVLFKTQIAGPPAFIDGRSIQEILIKAVSLVNAWPTLRAMVLEAFDPVHWAFLYPVALGAVIIWIRPLLRGYGMFSLLIPVMLLAYFGIYLVTPAEIETHLSSSLNRLMLQLWPGFTLLAVVAHAAGVARINGAFRSATSYRVRGIWRL